MRPNLPGRTGSNPRPIRNRNGSQEGGRSIGASLLIQEVHAQRPAITVTLLLAQLRDGNQDGANQLIPRGPSRTARVAGAYV